MKTRDLILKVAEEEFSKLGYDALSMNNLVQKLNINKATVYYHFKDKKSLYQDILEDVILTLNEKIKKVLESDLEAKERFKEYIKKYIEIIDNRPTIIPMILREMANFGIHTNERHIELVMVMMNDLKAIIDTLPLKDKYKNMDPFSLYSLVHGPIDNFYVIQMSELPVGVMDKEMKGNSKNSLEYISNFISNILLDAVCKE